MIITLEMMLNEPKLPKDYPPACVSLIKNALFKYNEDLFNSVYKEKAEKEKDFCFSLRFIDPKFEADRICLEDKELQMQISILDFAEGIDFYNAFLKQVGKKYPFPNDNEIVINKVKMQNHKPIKSNAIIIKMKSPLLVRKHESGIDTYLSCLDEDFQKYFELSIKNMLSNFEDKKDLGEIKIVPIKAKKTVVNTFGSKITGNIGIYSISGNSDVLNLMYKLGIGSRRSQGFGMFDVVLEVK